MPVPTLLDSQIRAGGAEATKAKATIQATLTRHQGALDPSAEELGISRRTLYRLLGLLGLLAHSFKQRVKSGLVDERNQPHKLRGSATSKSHPKGAKKQARKAKGAATV